MKHNKSSDKNLTIEQLKNFYGKNTIDHIKYIGNSLYILFSFNYNPHYVNGITNNILLRGDNYDIQ